MTVKKHKQSIITYKLLLIRNNFKYFGFRHAHYVLPYIYINMCVCVCSFKKLTFCKIHIYEISRIKNKYEATSAGNFPISI